MKNLIMKNRLKEIYLFYEYKNLIVNSVKNIFIKEKKEKEKEKQKKEKEKQKEKEKEKEKSSKKTISPESSKNNGIKGIIRVVTKKDNSKKQNNVYHINSYDKNSSVININQNNNNDSA